MKSSSYFLIIILILMAAVVGKAWTFPHLESKLFPVLLGSIGFVLAGIELWREIAAKGAGKTDFDIGRVEIGNEIRRFGMVMGWILGFFASIYLLGFFVAIPLFVFSYLKRSGREWLASIGLASLLTVLVYVVFELGLGVELYRGLFPSLIGA